MAGVTRTGGYQDYSSSGTTRYNPEVWSGKLTLKFYAATCASVISSHDYEGEIRGLGDNIIIRRTPDVSVAAYSIGSTLSYQQPAKDAVNLPINKALSWQVGINTVDRYESDIDLLSMFEDDAAQQVKIKQDTDFFSTVPAGVAATNAGATAGAITAGVNLGDAVTPVSITESNAIDYLLDLGQVLDESNVGNEDRWVGLPSWYIRRLKGSDLKDASITGDGQSVLRNGRVGMLDRFTIYHSNLLDVTGANTTILAGVPSGVAWAAQFTETELLPNPNDFGSLARGLCVYGHKVIEGTHLASGVVTPG